MIEMPWIMSVEFHNKVATVVYWSDGDVTRVVAKGGDKFNPESGLAFAVAKKFFGCYTDFENELSDASYFIDQKRVPNYDESKKKTRSTKKTAKKSKSK